MRTSCVPSAVFETLYFAAMLRLPSTLPKAEKVARVELVIDVLGLSKCRDTIIGGGGMRGVSGEVSVLMLAVFFFLDLYLQRTSWSYIERERAKLDIGNFL